MIILTNIKDKAMTVLHRIGPAIMPVVAILPIAGLMLGIGTGMTQETVLNALPFLENSFWTSISSFMIAFGNLIIGNLSVLFAISIAVVMSGNKGIAGLSAFIGYITATLTISTFGNITIDSISENSSKYTSVLGIPTLNTGVLTGVVIGIITFNLYKRYKDVSFPTVIQFFQGEKFIPIISALAGIATGLVFLVIWPPIQNGLDWFSSTIVESQFRFLTVFLYGAIARLVQAFGLHHFIWTIFNFQVGSWVNSAGEVLHGDLPIFFAQMSEGFRPMTAGGFITGTYIAGVFGAPAIAYAFYKEAKKKNRKKVAGLLISVALTSILTGITEPIEFAFLFISPLLWVVWSVYCGLGYAVTDLLNIRVGTSLAGNVLDFFLYGVIPDTTNWWLLIPVGLVFSISIFFVFRFFIRKFDIKTPGREEVVEQEELSYSDGSIAAGVLNYLGGKSNITNVTNCVTRVRATVTDMKNVQVDRFKELGAMATMKVGKNNLQIVFGAESAKIANQINDILEGKEPLSENNSETISETNYDPSASSSNISLRSPATGKYLELSEVPDVVFSEGMMGDGFAIQITDKKITSPINGVITSIFPTNHAICLTDESGLEILLHIGLETVNLNGQGFNIKVEENQTVSIGDVLMEIDIDAILKNDYSLISPIIFLNRKIKTISGFGEDLKVGESEIDITFL